MKFTLAEKVNMTQLFDQNGRVVPVTILKSKGVTVTGLRNKERDGYDAIQVKSNISNVIKEFRTGSGDLQIGANIAADVFSVGDIVKISGTTKGKGFQGVVKRHGFKGGWAQHGQKHSSREAGSIGSTGQQRVDRGKKMAGRMGSDHMTFKSVEILDVDTENGLILVKGQVPGSRGSLIEIRG